MNNVLVFFIEISWYVLFGFCVVNNIIWVVGYYGFIWYGGFIEFLSCVYILVFVFNFYFM